MRSSIKKQVSVRLAGRTDTLFIEFPFYRKRIEGDVRVFEMVLNPDLAKQIRVSQDAKGRRVELLDVKPPLWSALSPAVLLGQGEHQLSAAEFLNSVHNPNK